MRARLLCLGFCACSSFQTNPDLSPPDYSPKLLASGFVLPLGVEVSDRHAYVLEFGPQNQGLEGTLSRVDKVDGCAQADAGCRDILADMRFNVASLALASNDVCWLEYYEPMRELWCLDLTSARVRRLADNQPSAFALSTDGSSLFWVNLGMSGSIATRPIGAGAVTTLASGRSLPTTVAADSAGVYWTEQGAVIAAGPAGESPHEVAGGLREPLGVRPLGDWLYFVEQLGGRVLRARKDGGGVEPLAEGESNPIALSVDDAGVYWIAMGTPPNYLDGQVVRADLDGQHRRVVATDQPYLSGVAADDTSVYWIVEGTEAANYLDGALWRAPKLQ
jgi:sugar lactone lactonase YvrE